MNVPWARVEPLADHHDVGGFSSGRDSVDTWLRDKAHSSRHFVSTHVCVTEVGTVCGFFALKTIIVNTSGLPRRLRSSGNPRGDAPAVMLAQMGLREAEHGNGHGRALFWQAVLTVRAADAASRVPLFVVDAADEGLVTFYEREGMKRVPNSLRLVALISRLPA